MIESVSEKYFALVRAVDIAGYRAGLGSDTLLIEKADDLTVEYAPFDYIETGAELAIVGLTPGRTQAANAIETFSNALQSNVPIDAALIEAKRVASFSGAMRANLLAMLDAVGVPAAFGRRKSADFFSQDDGLVHFTSALRYPVYIAGKNYSGVPNPLRHAVLRGMIEKYLLEEVFTLPKALWIPLGKHAEEALLHLSDMGHIARDRILAGLPHPSGANAERIAYFLGRKSAAKLSSKTNAARLDELKTQLTEQISRIASKSGRL